MSVLEGPVGVTGAMCSWGSLYDTFGRRHKITVEIRPFFGVDPSTGKEVQSIAYAPTGESLTNTPAKTSVFKTEPASWFSPHVDQAGFVDGSGNAFTMWSYLAVATVTPKLGGDSITLEKAYQPLVGQAVVDLDLVPDGSIAAPSSAPIPAVTSFLGHTGSIDTDQFDTDLTALGANSASEFAQQQSSNVAGARIATTVTYSGGLPSTETIPLATGGNLVKTYHWDTAGNPTTCDWNYPTGTDYVETFTYDGGGNATGSTFAGV